MFNTNIDLDHYMDSNSSDTKSGNNKSDMRLKNQNQEHPKVQLMNPKDYNGSIPIIRTILGRKLKKLN